MAAVAVQWPSIDAAKWLLLCKGCMLLLCKRLDAAAKWLLMLCQGCCGCTMATAAVPRLLLLPNGCCCCAKAADAAYNSCCGCVKVADAVIMMAMQ